MFKINLVPEVKQEQLKINKINTILTSTAIGAGVSILVIIVLFSIYIGARAAQISGIDKETTKVNEELVAYKDLENTVISLETGLAEIKQVLNGGHKWSKFFVELEKVTPVDIQINNFSIENNNISMDLTGRNVKSIDRFIKSFSTYKNGDQLLFKDVVVSGFSKKDGGQVSFQSKMTFVGGLE